MKKHSFMAVALLAVALVLASCTGKKTNSEEQTNTPAPCAQQCNGEGNGQCGSESTHACQNAAQHEHEGCASEGTCAENKEHQCSGHAEKASCSGESTHKCKNPAGCQCNATMTPEKLFDKEYKVVAINGTQMNLKEEELPTMGFVWAEKRVAGTTGCNRYFSQFETEGTKLAFQQAGATKMACPNMDLEDQFLAAFAKVKMYEYADGNIRLMDEAKNVVLVLK